MAINRKMTSAERFPPIPDHKHEYPALVAILKILLRNHKADYVSCPYTTGKRFVDWYIREGCSLDPKSRQYKLRHMTEVVIPNELDAMTYIDRLEMDSRFVIAPTFFNLDHWTQNDYRCLWANVIRDYARRILFLDGWEFSKGCVYEFYTAAVDPESPRTPVFRQDGAPLSLYEARTRLTTAIEYMQTNGLSVHYMEDALAAYAQTLPRPRSLGG